ncbi:MAG: glycosyltransferase [Deltaproteobacteria bacterium]|nr:glycosyltransferase [Deltaproteobacteria bacterium]
MKSSEVVHLCIITSSYPLNPEDSRAAAGLFVQDFALAVHELGHEVTVLTPDKRPGQKVSAPGISVEWFPWLGGAKTLSSMKPWQPLDAASMASLFPAGIWALERLHRERPIDRVLAMWAVPSGLLASWLKHRAGVPYDTWCLGSDIWTYGKLPGLRRAVAAVLRDSDRVFADGLKLGRDAAALGGVEVDFLASSRRLPRPEVMPEEREGFAFVGRYAEVKGVDVLLRAMRRYLDAGGTQSLTLHGGGPEEATLRSLIDELRLGEHVTLGGFADEARVVELFSSARCVVIPSRMESLPVVLSDAAQLGAPVIVTEVGDMGELVSRHGAGRVVDAEDEAGLAEAMLEMERGDSADFEAGVASLAAELSIETSARSLAGQWSAKNKERAQ